MGKFLSTLELNMHFRVLACERDRWNQKCKDIAIGIYYVSSVYVNPFLNGYNLCNISEHLNHFA